MALLRTMLLGPLCLAVAWSAAAPPASGATQIGTTATATNKVTGALEKNVRQLKTGDGVFRKEQIDTGAKSKAQLMFADETTLTVGANSSVTLDEFVYDSDKTSGKALVRATKGTLRFISGSLKKGSYKIETPVATLGIRGTIVELMIRDKYLIVSVYEGGVEMCNKVQRCTFLKAGTYAITDGSKISEAKTIISHGGTVFVDSPNPLFTATLGTPVPLMDVQAAPPVRTPKPHPPKKRRFCFICYVIKKVLLHQKGRGHHRYASHSHGRRDNDKKTTAAPNPPASVRALRRIRTVRTVRPVSARYAKPTIKYQRLRSRLQQLRRRAKR